MKRSIDGVLMNHKDPEGAQRKPAILDFVFLRVLSGLTNLRHYRRVDRIVSGGAIGSPLATLPKRASASRGTKCLALAVVLLLIMLLAGAMAQSPAGSWLTISRDNLCITEGAIEKSGERLLVSVPKMRAYVTAPTAQSVEVRFKYLGPTSKDAPLGSGIMRRQFGFKLHAQDPCNLVYAIWRIEPESKLVVSLKRNPNQHTSAECGNRGYQNIKPRKASPVPRLEPGQSHTLRAEMKADELRVFVDNQPVWEGLVGRGCSLTRRPSRHSFRQCASRIRSVGAQIRWQRSRKSLQDRRFRLATVLPKLNRRPRTSVHLQPRAQFAGEIVNRTDSLNRRARDVRHRHGQFTGEQKRGECLAHFAAHLFENGTARDAFLAFAAV
jgi:hypothetical protein